MTGDEALAEIKRLAAGNQIRYSGHARQRMSERGATRSDIRNALLTATDAVFQSDRDTWRVEGGVDRDGQSLTVVVALEGDVLVVTLF